MTTVSRIKSLLISMLLALPVQAQPWPSAPPAIGRLVMPQAYWKWTLEAAKEHKVSPYVIQGFMAIESRYKPWATSGRGRCVGLMQLNRDVARSLGVNPWDERENIHGGAKILSGLMRKYRGNLEQVARAYHGPGCPPAYVREVVRAVSQAKSNGRRMTAK